MSNLYGHNHKRLLQTPLDWAKCGTEANYRGHYRRGEKPCTACRKAANRAWRARHNDKRPNHKRR